MCDSHCVKIKVIFALLAEMLAALRGVSTLGARAFSSAPPSVRLLLLEVLSENVILGVGPWQTKPCGNRSARSTGEDQMENVFNIVLKLNRLGKYWLLRLIVIQAATAMYRDMLGADVSGEQVCAS